MIEILPYFADGDFKGFSVLGPYGIFRNGDINYFSSFEDALKKARYASTSMNFDLVIKRSCWTYGVEK